VRPALPDPASWRASGDNPSGIGPAGEAAMASESADMRSLVSIGPPGLLDIRPGLDPAAVASGGHLVLLNTECDLRLRYYRWLALTCIATADREGRPSPILMGVVDSVADVSKRVGWDLHSLAGYALAHPPGDGCVSDPASREAAAPGPSPSCVAWARRIADASRPVVESEDAGVWTARDGGRSVHAFRTGPEFKRDRSLMDHHAILVVAVSAEGVMTGARIQSPDPIPDADIRAVLRDAIQAGIEGSLRGKAMTYKSAPVRDLVSGFTRGIMPLAAAVRLRAMLIAEHGEEWGWVQDAATDSRNDFFIQTWGLSGPDPRVRAQFLRSMPAFADLAMDAEVSRLVDARLSPMRRLSELTGMRGAVLRRYGSRAMRFGELGLVHQWRQTGAVVQALGLGTLPHADGLGSYQWFALIDCMRGVTSFAGLAHPLEPALVAGLMRSLPGRTWAERYGWLTGSGKDEVADASDMLKSLRGWLADISGVRIMSGHPVTQRLLAGYGSMGKVVAASRRWHGMPLLHMRGRRIPDHVTWPVPFGAVDLGEGWSAVALDSPRALSLEGAHEDAIDPPDGMPGLGHCVGTYADRCYTGGSLVVSLRRNDGTRTRRASTLELKPRKNGRWPIAGQPFEAVQHRGLRNRPPGPEAEAAAERLRLLLAEDGVKVDAAALGRRMLPKADDEALADPEADALWLSLLPSPFPAMDRGELRAWIVSVDDALRVQRLGAADRGIPMDLA
jgi:hypothetical protein